MINPYGKCPILESEKYILRLVKVTDADDLLEVYSDKEAVPIFNSDNCNGDDFYYTSLERMQKAIEFWLWEYDRKAYVRWAIIDKEAKKGVGTIELFNRKATDYFNNCGLLRLDLRSDYEKEKIILEIVSLLIPSAFEIFDCQMIATKVPAVASTRKKALESIGFRGSKEVLVGGHGKVYGDYFVLNK